MISRSSNSNYFNVQCNRIILKIDMAPHVSEHILYKTQSVCELIYVSLSFKFIFVHSLLVELDWHITYLVSLLVPIIHHGGNTSEARRVEAHNARFGSRGVTLDEL